MTIGRMGIACLLLLLVSACAPNPINCDLVVVAKMPLEVRNRLLVVPAGIGGKWVTLLVDTGAEAHRPLRRYRGPPGAGTR